MKTPYERMNGKKPTVKYFHVFEMCLRMAMNIVASLNPKHFKQLFVGYSHQAYKVFIIDLIQVKESVNVTFDDTKLPSIQIEDPLESLKFDNYPDSDSDDDYLMLQQVMTITMLIMIQVMVEKIMETLWTLLILVVDHLVNLTAAQGEMVDQPVKHNITMIVLANHQD